MTVRKIYFQKEQITKTKVKGYVEVEIDFTQIYHTIFKHIKNINDKWALKYIFWILDKANDDNMIPHGDETIREFINEFEEEDKPSIKTIRDAITELVKNKIFIKYGYGQYQLNPIIIWGESAKLRTDHLVKLKENGFTEEDLSLIEDKKDIKLLENNSINEI